MRYIKVLSLAAIVAVAAMAFIGTGSASAAVKRTVLCKVNQPLCKAANLWTLPATVLAKSTVALLLGNLTVECESETTIVAETADADRLLGKITALTWSNCKGCTEATTTKLATGSLFPDLEKGKEGNGKLVTTSETTVLLKGCTVFKVDCTASAATAELLFSGGKINSTALAEAKEVKTSLTGFGCGSEGKWDAGPGVSEPYVVTSVNGDSTKEIWLAPESHA